MFDMFLLIAFFFFFFFVEKMVPIDLIEPYGVASFHGLGGSYANIIN